MACITIFLQIIGGGNCPPFPSQTTPLSTIIRDRSNFKGVALRERKAEHFYEIKK